MNTHHPPTPTRETSALALTSLIAGLLGVSILPFVSSIVAIITGHLARAEIRRDPARYSGDGFVIAGLVLGYACVAAVVAVFVGVLMIFGTWIWYEFTP